jgi:DNA-binding transcriptional LysR family regulator
VIRSVAPAAAASIWRLIESLDRHGVRASALLSRTPQGIPLAHAAACTYWQEVLTLVSMGRGASPAPLRAVQYPMRPGIIYLPLRDANPIDYGLLWRRTGATARVMAFADTVCEIAGIPGPPAYALRTGSSSPAGS